MSNTRETTLLDHYRVAFPAGVLFTESEIPLPGGRRLDAVRLPSAASTADFQKACDSHGAEPVEVIEVKSGLSEEVVGQVLVGVEMLRHGFPTLRMVEPVVVCEAASPQMLEVAGVLGIRVWSLGGKHLRTRPDAYMTSRKPSMWKRDTWVAAVEPLRAREKSLFITDVPLGGTTINLIRVRGGPELLAKFETTDRFRALIGESSVELIEVRKKARRGVAGRLLSHKILLETQYGIVTSKLRVIAFEPDAELGRAFDALDIDFGLPEEHARKT